MAMLQVLKGLNPGQQFALDGERMIMGRHPDCDIVLEVGAVSRQHAQIVREGSFYYVEDLKSRNGTFLNGKAVEGRAMLQENDRVKICDLLFTFHHDPSDVDESGAPPVASSPETGVTVEDGPSNMSTIMGTLSLGDNGSLRVAVRPEVKLKAMIEISQNLATSVSVEEVLPKILQSLFKIFGQADRGFILLMDPESGMLVPKATQYRRSDRSDENIRISKTIVNQVLKQKEAILSADAVSDSRFDMSQSVADFRIRSMMCVPMFDSEEKALGLIQVDTQDQMQRFEQDDLDVLVSVANQAAFAIENAQLHESLLKQQVMERELEFGHKVQQGFLPTHPPRIPGYEFFDYYKPARAVGGDYYDYVVLPNNQLAVILADVSGKGVPAALLMAKLSSEVRYCLVSEPTPAQAVDKLNLAFTGNWEDRFVTLVLFVIDLYTHRVTLVNAGHMPPLLRKASGELDEIDMETGLPIGVTTDVTYGQFQFQLRTNESLTAYTDGFSEAMNTNRDLYGLQRLRNCLSNGGGAVSQLGDRVLTDVRQFIGQQPQSDDMCIVCFGRTPT